MYSFTLEVAAQMIADEPALATLLGFDIQTVWEKLDAPEDAEDEGEAFAKLMGVMYDLRPVGHL